MGCHVLLQGIFPDQGSNLHLPHEQVDSLPLACTRACVYLIKLSAQEKTGSAEEQRGRGRGVREMGPCPVLHSGQTPQTSEVLESKSAFGVTDLF